MFSGTAQVSHQVCQFFVGSVCLLVRVTMVDKNKAVVCCLLATSAIMLRSGICDVHLLNELLEMEMMPSWCRQVN